MAIHEDFAPERQELPPGIERRTGRRSSPERSSRGAGREQGGLRIRLSDNELRAAQVIQERFQLRSTVAALGFCLRTMAQMVEHGELSEENLAAQLPQHTGTSGRGDGQQPPKQAPADPLARPAKQQPEPAGGEQPPHTEPETEASTASTTDSPQAEEA